MKFKSNIEAQAKIFVGDTGSANAARFPNSLAVVSTTPSGIQQNETLYIGLIAEGVSVGDTWGSGIYGVGYTNSTGTGRGTGVTGEAHVSAATDTGVAVGVRGYAHDVHTGNYNIGLYGDATNGDSGLTYGGNVALFLANGNIVTSAAANKNWFLGGNLTFNGQGTTKTISVTNGAKFDFGGTSSQFVKGDGSLDSNVYALDNTVVKLTGDQTINGIKNFYKNIIVKGMSVGSDDAYETSVILGQSANAINGGVSIGRLVGSNLTTGEANVGVGSLALHYVTNGNNNTAIGALSLTNITTGTDNVGVGLNAGSSITEGNRNIIISSNSTVTPLGITTGNANTIIGRVTGLSINVSNNVILADGDENKRFWWDGTDIRLFGNLKVEGQARSTYSEDAAVTGTKTLNFNEGNIAFYTLTGSTTITLSNAIAGAVYTIRLTQGGSGSYTVTWDPLVKWGGGTTPTLSTAVGAIDIVTLLYDGTNFYGNIVKNFA